MGSRGFRVVAIGAAVALTGFASLAGGAAGAATARAATGVTASLSVSQTTSSTGFSGAGDAIGLGFLVTNTGKAALTGVGVADTIDGGSVPVSCASSALLPGAQTTCNASYTVTSGDAAAGSVSSSAVASGSDYVPKVVHSPASVLQIPSINSASSPLLATPLPLWAGQGSDYAPFLTNWTDNLINWGGITNPNTPQNWTVSGTSSSGQGVCSQTSTPPTTGPVAGVLCVGATTLTGDAYPVIQIAVPTPTVEIPVECINSSGLGSFYPDTENFMPCSFTAQVSTDGSTWTNAGSTVTLNPTSSSNGCPPNPAGFEESVPGSSPWCPAFGDLIVPLTSAEQYLQVVQNNTAYPNGCYYYYNPPSTNNNAPNCETPPLQIDVEPTARVQAGVLVNRIIYQPPGAGSSQSFAESQGQSTETDLTFGNSNAGISETNTTLGLDTSLSAGAAWATLNFSDSANWTTDTTSTNTTANSNETTDTISTDFGTTMQTPTWKTGASPNSPPWLNDEFDLLVNPQFDVWDFTACTTGTPIAVNDSTACPQGSDQLPDTGIAPISVYANEQVTVAQLVPCVEGKGTFTLSNLVTLTQAQCQQIVAQDPFAATGLGLAPTPAGEAPGQATNPAVLLNNQAATPFTAITQPAKSTQTLTKDYSNVGTNSYTASSSMETDVSAVESNQISVGVSTHISIGPIFSVDASASFNYGQTNTQGTDLVENYTGTQTFTQSQEFTTQATLTDPHNAISVTPYWDPRYDTFMFQSGQDGNNTTPVISSVAPVTVKVTKSLKAGQVLAAGAALPVSALPLPVATGQQLRLPSGQYLTASKAAAVGAKTVHVAAATITTAVAKKAPVGLVGSVDVTGSGFLNGPVAVSFCTNAAKVPTCKTGTATTVPYSSAGTTLLATTTLPPGTDVSVSVRTQSGSTPGLGTSYTIQ
jgi:hypothetical protein